MATGNGILRKMCGSVGDLTYRVVNGQQTVAARVSHVKNPRTEGQMNQRTKWANLLAMFRAGAPALLDAFENKIGKTSDYNRFMSINLQSNGVYLTKQMAAQGGGIAAPYQITQGSLPAIQVYGEGTEAVTDLKLGSLAIDAATTIGQLAAAILAGNDNWMEGDQLSFFCFKQMFDQNEGMPYVVCQKSRTTLRLTDTTPVQEVFPAYACGVKNQCLAAGEGLPEGAFAWVHSRKGKSKTLVSSQRLQVYNSIYATYTSASAQTNSILSYGVSNNAFLKPLSDSGQQTNPSGGQQSTDNSQQTPSGGNQQTKAKYTVTVVSADESMGTVTGGGEYEEGTEVTLKATAKSGYTFSKWNDGNTSSTRKVTVSANAEYTAQFAEQSQTPPSI